MGIFASSVPYSSEYSLNVDIKVFPFIFKVLSLSYRVFLSFEFHELLKVITGL